MTLSHANKRRPVVLIRAQADVSLQEANLISAWLQPGVTGDRLISKPFRTVRVALSLMITALKCGANENLELTHYPSIDRLACNALTRIM